MTNSILLMFASGCFLSFFLSLFFLNPRTLADWFFSLFAASLFSLCFWGAATKYDKHTIWWSGSLQTVYNILSA